MLDPGVGALSRLNKLYVARNKLTSLPADLWRRGRRLDTLDVAGNPLLEPAAAAVPPVRLPVPSLLEVPILGVLDTLRFDLSHSLFLFFLSL